MGSVPDSPAATSNHGRQPIADALDAAVSTYEVSPLDEPRRAAAIVADLVGDPTTSSTADVIALRLALTELAARSDPPSKVDRSAVVTTMVEHGLSRADAERALDTVLDVLDLGPLDSPTFGRRWLIAAPLAAAVSIALGIALWPDGDQDAQGSAASTTDPDASTVATESTSATTTSVGNSGTSTDTTTAPETTTTSTSTTTPERHGLTATFQSVREGAFAVERGWRVTPGQQELVGVVRLGSPDGGTASGLHRELAPAIVGDGSAVEWTPEPAQRVNRVASFAGITLAPGESLEIEFRAPIDPEATLTESDLLTWFETWRVDAEAIRSALGESDELLEPVITTET